MSGVDLLPTNSVIKLGDRAGVALTLDRSYANRWIEVPAQTVGGLTLTLPAVASARGDTYNFFTSGTAGQIVTITSGAANTIKGAVVLRANSAAAMVLQGASATSIGFTAACTVGAVISLYSNGTNWIILRASASGAVLGDELVLA